MRNIAGWLWLHYLCLFLTLSTVSSQQDGKYPFVSVPDLLLSVENSTTKTFSTRIEVVVKNVTAYPFNLSRFHEAATSFYTNVRDLKGFQKLENVAFKFRSATNNTVEVSYDIVYNYVTLRDNVASTWMANDLIGRLSYVKAGLEADANFSTFYEVGQSPNSFSFTSDDSLCRKRGCSSPYLECVENDIEIFVTCRSICKTPFCDRGGWCIQHDADTAPVCSCPSTSNTWYVGTHCEMVLELWMFVVFCVVVFLVLVIIAVIACCLPVITRRKKQLNHPMTENSSKPRSNQFQPKTTIIITPREKTNVKPVQQEKVERREPEVQLKGQTSLPSFLDDQSETMIASSGDGFDAGYEAVLTHRFDTSESNSRLARRNRSLSSYSADSSTENNSTYNDVALSSNGRQTNKKSHQKPLYTSVNKREPRTQMLVV